MLKRKIANNEHRENKRSKFTIDQSDDIICHSMQIGMHICHNCSILSQKIAILEKKIENLTENDDQSNMWEHYIS